MTGLLLHGLEAHDRDSFSWKPGLLGASEPLRLGQEQWRMGSFYRSAHELVFLFKHGEGRYRNNVQLGKFGRNRTNVWNYPGANTFSRHGVDADLLALHPTLKPVALIMDAIKDCTARGDLVLDPFLGTGTTVIAAERSGRRCYGIELDPLYIDTIIRRWQRHTKLDAVHAASGMTFNIRESAKVGLS